MRAMRRKLMAPSRFYKKVHHFRSPRGAIVLLLLLSSYCVSSLTAAIAGSFVSTERFNPERMAIGSRPPSCTNKCFNCSPCAITLVIPPPKRKSFPTATPREDDEGYYLLSWRCRCGNRLFNP